MSVTLTTRPDDPALQYLEAALKDLAPDLMKESGDFVVVPRGHSPEELLSLLPPQSRPRPESGAALLDRLVRQRYIRIESRGTIKPGEMLRRPRGNGLVIEFDARTAKVIGALLIVAGSLVIVTGVGIILLSLGQALTSLIFGPAVLIDVVEIAFSGLGIIVLGAGTVAIGSALVKQSRRGKILFEWRRGEEPQMRSADGKWRVGGGPWKLGDSGYSY